MKRKRVASIIRIEPKQILVWWDGKAHTDLLAFDPEGRKLMFDSLGTAYGMQPDKTSENVRRFLESWLLATKYDFNVDGKLDLTEKKVKRMLHIK